MFGDSNGQTKLLAKQKFKFLSATNLRNTYHPSPWIFKRTLYTYIKKTTDTVSQIGPLRPNRGVGTGPPRSRSGIELPTQPWPFLLAYTFRPFFNIISRAPCLPTHQLHDSLTPRCQWSKRVGNAASHQSTQMRRTSEQYNMEIEFLKNSINTKTK